MEAKEVMSGEEVNEVLKGLGVPAGEQTAIRAGSMNPAVGT